MDTPLTKTVHFRKRINIWYTYKGQKLRFSTGISVSEENLPENILRLAVLRKRVDDLISQYMIDHKARPPVSWLKEKLEEPERIQTIEILPLLNIAVTERRNKLKDQSIKDWTNLVFAMKRFEEKYGKVFLTDINRKWYDKFQIFLSLPYKHKSKVAPGLNNNTIRKRITTLNVFLKEHNVPIVKFDKIEEYDIEFEVITRQELRTILDLPLTGSQEEIRDMFVILCLTGLRHSDYMRLNGNHIKDDIIYIKSQKTNILSVIPLHDVVKELFEKYTMKYSGEVIGDFQHAMDTLKHHGVVSILNLEDKPILALPKFAVQHFNREIKKVLASVPAFQKYVQVETYSYKKKRNNITQRFQRIHSHTGRHTLITLLINENMHPSKIIEVTGHKNARMLDKYYKKHNEPNSTWINKIKI